VDLAGLAEMVGANTVGTSVAGASIPSSSEDGEGTHVGTAISVGDGASAEALSKAAETSGGNVST